MVIVDDAVEDVEHGVDADGKCCRAVASDELREPDQRAEHDRRLVERLIPTTTNHASALFLHGVCMLSERMYGECAHEQHVRRTLTLTLTHTITAYSVKMSCAYSSVHHDSLTCLTTKARSRSLETAHLRICERERMFYYRVCV